MTTTLSEIGFSVLIVACAVMVWLGPLPRSLLVAFTTQEKPRLHPDEHVVLTVRPDPGVMGLLGMSVCVGLVAFQTGLVLMGADPVHALSLSAIPFAALATGFALELRKGWIITNRRLLTRAGASLPLAQIRRLYLGPGLLRIDADGGRGMAMLGVRDPLAVARLLQAIAERHSR